LLPYNGSDSVFFPTNAIRSLIATEVVCDLRPSVLRPKQCRLARGRPRTRKERHSETNVYNAVFFVGEGSGPAPLAGSLEVRQSAFLEVAAGAVAITLQDAAVAIIGNTSQRTSWPVQISDLNRTSVTVAGNRFQDGSAGIQIFDSCAPGEALCGISNSQLLLVGNQLTESTGIDISAATFRDGVSCTVVGNDIHYDAANGGVVVWLGPGTKDCRVVTKGAVRDDGTGNKVIILP
jgi:hypothetical protein